jgi:sensor histidine kinase regulating citrate/malate metabolism
MQKEDSVSPDGSGTTEGTGTKKLEKKPSRCRRFIRKRPVTTTALIGLLAVVVVFFGKEIQVKLQRKSFVKTANVQLLESNKAMLKVLSKSVDWTIRSEMLRGNMEQVNLLMSELVKDSHFQYIHLVGQNGIILLSTNKKHEGQPIENENVRSVLNADSTTVITEAKDTVITVISPVMGDDKRLGTLVMGYIYESVK